MREIDFYVNARIANLTKKALSKKLCMTSSRERDNVSFFNDLLRLIIGFGFFNAWTLFGESTVLESRFKNLILQNCTIFALFDLFDVKKSDDIILVIF